MQVYLIGIRNKFVVKNEFLKSDFAKDMISNKKLFKELSKNDIVCCSSPIVLNIVKNKDAYTAIEEVANEFNMPKDMLFAYELKDDLKYVFNSLNYIK